MIKLVVSDLDGTLLPYGESEIKKQIFERIEALISKGIYFAVSSGRIYSELCEFLKPFRDKIYFISSDGALLTFQDKIIFQKPFTYDALNYAINSCNKSTLAFYSADKVYSFNDTEKTILDSTRVLKPFEIKHPVFKIVSSPSQIPMFDGLHARVHYSDGSVSEYVPPFANKGIALGALQRHLGVSLYETLALGDSVNDIPMMKNARFSCSIGKSSSRLSAVCRFSFDSADTVLEKVWINPDFDN